MHHFNYIQFFLKNPQNDQLEFDWNQIQNLNPMQQKKSQKTL